MTVQMGNGFYFLYVGIALVYFFVLFFCLKNKDKKVQHTTLVVILFLNLALHFLKQFFEPYRSNFPTSLRRSTFENICAVSTMLFPFIYLGKKQNVLHDYVFFIGLCGGFGALFYPTEAIGHAAFSFDVIRFYICHTQLVAIPLLAAVLGIYRPRIKKIWAIPLLFLAQETIICLNEYFLVGVGLVDCEPSQLLDRGYRNTSMVFGLMPSFDALKGMIDALVPAFFRTDAFNLNGGKDFYFPVLWMILPVFVFFPILYAILTAPFWIADIVNHRRSHASSHPQTK